MSMACAQIYILECQIICPSTSAEMHQIMNPISSKRISAQSNMDLPDPPLLVPVDLQQFLQPYAFKADIVAHLMIDYQEESATPVQQWQPRALSLVPSLTIPVDAHSHDLNNHAERCFSY